MAVFIHNLKTLTELRAREGELDSAVRVGDLGAIFLWNPASAATDDGIDVVKPASIATASPGRWVNDSKGNRYYNKTEKFNLPVKVLIDRTYQPNANPFVINISHMGLTDKPLWFDVKARESQRNNMDYVEATVNETLTTKDQLVVEFARPAVAINLLGANVKAKLANNANAFTGITLSVHIIGI